MLCSRCHEEAGHYNSRHPLGTKYSPTELRKHRDDWWQYCETYDKELRPKDNTTLLDPIPDAKGGVNAWGEIDPPLTLVRLQEEFSILAKAAGLVRVREFKIDK